MKQFIALDNDTFLHHSAVTGCLKKAACWFATRKTVSMAGPKLGNAPPPPEVIFRSPLKFFSWMVMQKSEPRRSDARLGGLGACPPENFAEFDLILVALCAF